MTDKSSPPSATLGGTTDVPLSDGGELRHRDGIWGIYRNDMLIRRLDEYESMFVDCAMLAEASAKPENARDIEIEGLLRNMASGNDKDYLDRLVDHRGRLEYLQSWAARLVNETASVPSETPRNRIIEECAQECDPDENGPEGIVYQTKAYLAKQIRALKNAAPQATAQDAKSREEADAGRNRQHGTPVGAAPETTLSATRELGHAVTQAMYEAGMKYLNGRGTAWCCTDLYLAMEAKRVSAE